MEKLAVCLYGFLRNYKNCYKSLMEKIVKPHNADIYIFTPNQISDSDFDTIIPTERLKQVYNTNNIKRWNYNRVQFLYDTSYLPKFNIHYQRPYRYMSLSYHISKAVQMVFKKYKWVYLTRPDVPVSYFDLSKANNKKINFRINKDSNLPIDDKYILGNSKNIKIFKTFYKKTKNMYIKNNKINLEPTSLVRHHIKEHNIPINFCKFTKNIYKHKCTPLCGHHLMKKLDKVCTHDNNWFYFKKREN